MLDASSRPSVMRRVILLLAVTLSLVTSARTCAGADELKRFLNLDAPKTALNSPFVWTQNNKVTLAGLYWRNGQRDVSVLRYDGNAWKPVGSNGLAVTGVGGNFLVDVALDANGTPWLLTYYTKPSNSDRANRFFLYALKDGKWTVMGPPNGHKADGISGGSLFFLNGKTPVLFYQTWSRRIQNYEHRVYILRMGVWEKSTFGTIIGRDSLVQFEGSRIYVIRHNIDDWSIHELSALDVSTLPAPIHRFKVDAEWRVGGVLLRNRDAFVLKLYDDQSAIHLRLYEKSGDGMRSRDIEPPDEHLLESMIGWTPTGDLCVATNDLQTVRAYILQRDNTWKLVGTAHEPTGATIFDPALAFGPDGKPVVTWEAFWPH